MNGSNEVVTISAAQKKLLDKLLDKARKDKEYRQRRNARPDVKIKNAIAHEKGAIKHKAYRKAFKYLYENGLLTEKQKDLLHQEVPEFKDYVDAVEEEQAVDADLEQDEQENNDD